MEHNTINVYTCIIVQLEHQPFGCQDHVLTWRVAWTNICASTRRFYKSLEGTFILQIEEGLVGLEIVSLSVVFEKLRSFLKTKVVWKMIMITRCITRLKIETF